MHKKSHIVLIILVVVVTSVILFSHRQKIHASRIDPQSLVLLLPDSIEHNSPKVKVWIDALHEEGLKAIIMRDSDFLNPARNRSQIAGIIIPDQVHKVASEILIDTLVDYVEHGGKLMLVFDAGVWTTSRVYASNKSRFSRLVGIEYAFYDRLNDRTTNREALLGNALTYRALNIPPGKYTEYNDIPESLRQGAATTLAHDKPLYTLTGYFEPALQYDYFVTSDGFQGETLLQTPKGNLVAGKRDYGTGNVLFVNLSLGYLKIRTDGLLLHGFIRYFADHIIQLPYLASVPQGVGGLVLNWHLDTNAALRPLEKLKSFGFYEQGPYSVHLTSGPDAYKHGDGEGLNVPNNKIIKNWIAFFSRKGYEIGSHGGWIHDYFAKNLPNQPNPEFERYLIENKKTLEEVVGRPVLEYSAPDGNHPNWVTNWLNEHGVIAYYTAGNAGMAPTQMYREDERSFKNIWAFPILTHKWTSGFMEQAAYGFDNKEVSRWLRSVTDYCSQNNTVRMFYFHPRGPLNYPVAVREWLTHTEILQKERKFRWYTMASMARFLQQRIKVDWNIKQNNSVHTFFASHPTSLERMTWVLPREIYAKPEILQGSGKVKDLNDRWLIVADNVKNFQFSTKRR